jgi:hypothetical protein
MGNRGTKWGQFGEDARPASFPLPCCLLPVACCLALLPPLGMLTIDV